MYMIDLNKSAKDNFLILLNKHNKNVDYLRSDFERKIKFYERTSKGKQKLRTRSGKSFKHKLNMYKKMYKLAFDYSMGKNLK